VPIKIWEDKDEAWKDIVEGIGRAVSELVTRRVAQATGEAELHAKKTAILDAELRMLARERDQAYASQVAQLARIVLRAVASETRDCPRVFTLQPQDRRRFNPLTAVQQAYRLTLWCEYPDQQHPTCRIGSGGDGEYTFERPREWVAKMAPYASLVARTLATLAPIAAPAVKAVLTEDLLKDVGKHIEWMEKVATAFRRDEPSIRNRHVSPEWDAGGLTEAEGAGIRELHSLLLELDPAKTWGKLRRALAPTGEYMWLCPMHYRVYDPGLPVLP
jgi:hypothetical protein